MVVNNNSSLQAGPAVAVVMPVFKHSVLISEAIDSILSQTLAEPWQLVVVNDGCPFYETQVVCQEFTLAYPDRIHILYRTNGGLSAARNTGIDYILQKWPSIRAIYFLDSDNRILPDGLAHALAALDAVPEVSWVYPDITMFGMYCNYKYSGQYLSLMHLSMNISEAGSLVRRELFEAGLRFDEKMKLGYEDWEFWLQAVEKGFRGMNITNFGFRYRKRPESMLTNSTRHDHEIRSYIHYKHKNIYNPKAVVAIEHKETPRYALYIKDSSSVVFCTDPAERSVCISMEEYEKAFWQSVTAKKRYYSPGILVCTSAKCLAVLEKLGLLHWVFWQLERGLEEKCFSSLQIITGTDPLRLEFEDGIIPDQVDFETFFLMMPMAEVISILDKKSSLATLLTPEPDAAPYHLRLTLPPCEDLQISGAVTLSFLEWCQRLKTSLWRPSSTKDWTWGECPLHKRSEMYLVNRDTVDSKAPIFPKLNRPGEIHVAIALPLVAFGGVEKCALNLAHCLKKQGYFVHLVVVQSKYCIFNKENWYIFDSINFLNDSDIENYEDTASSPYMGAPALNWNDERKKDNALMLFSWLDVLINAHCVAINGLMAVLKKKNIITIDYAHIVDYSTMGRQVGHTFFGLGYESAYDMFLCGSRQLFDWHHGMGIPLDKLVYMPNAPGYFMSDENIQAVLKKRFQRTNRQRLHVLFLGRLDRQKGGQRLIKFAHDYKSMGLPIDLRIVGGNVVPGESVDQILFDSCAECPVYDSDALTDLFEWADILLMTSFWEGLPLTILEAQRLGVVVISTNVGAVEEVIKNGDNGFVLNGQEVISQAISIMQSLLDNNKLNSIMMQAASDGLKRSWDVSCKEFFQRLNKKVQSP